MATKKTSLSTGTLNLKFMMKASPNVAVPALEKRKVVDEAEWDVGPEVREAWGIPSSSEVGHKYATLLYLGLCILMKGINRFAAGQPCMGVFRMNRHICHSSLLIRLEVI